MGSCLERRRRKGACCHVGRVARTENRWTHRCVGCVVYRRAPTLVPFPSGRPFLYQPRPIPAETAKPRSSMLEKLKAPTCSTVAWLPRHRSHETAAKYRPSFPKYFRYSDSNDSRRERGGAGDMFGLKTGTNNCISVSLSERCLDIEGRWSRN